MVEVGEWAWMEMPGGDETRAKWSPELEQKLKELGIQASYRLGARSR